MKIIGINGGFGGGYQDPSAAILIDGILVAAIEEERVTRIKHATGLMPINAIIELLRITNVTMKEIDFVAFHGATWGDHIISRLQNFLIANFDFSPEIILIHHHHAHAASAIYSSGFKEALIFTLDGSGDGVSTRVSLAKDNNIEIIKDFARPQSFGLYYSAFTQFCGFKRDSDEYKLMGLAAYGNPNTYDLSEFLYYDSGSYRLNTKFLIDMPPYTASPNKQEMLFNENFENFFSVKRRTEKEINSVYKNIAASAQFQSEQTIISLVLHYIKLTGINKICLAGGVALNCMMNQKIINHSEISEVFIPPIAADMGISAGAAFATYHYKTNNQPKFHSVFCGNEYSNPEIQKTLQIVGAEYTESEDVISEAVQMLNEGYVIGWFQGKMEYGPRALGNRSILANPLINGMKDRVNSKIKFRESFRPFGASIIEEDVTFYFEGNNCISPFMTTLYNIKKEFSELLGSVTNVDGTCRIQSVNEKDNSLFYYLLKNFKEKTGHGILLNTSFNLNHEPIVCSPQNAIASYFSSGLDALIIGNFILKKRESI
jgi:carbamoyltransferase